MPYAVRMIWRGAGNDPAWRQRQTCAAQARLGAPLPGAHVKAAPRVVSGDAATRRVRGAAQLLQRIAPPPRCLSKYHCITHTNRTAARDSDVSFSRRQRW